MPCGYPEAELKAPARKDLSEILRYHCPKSGGLVQPGTGQLHILIGFLYIFPLRADHILCEGSYYEETNKRYLSFIPFFHILYARRRIQPVQGDLHSLRR